MDGCVPQRFLNLACSNKLKGNKFEIENLLCPETNQKVPLANSWINNITLKMKADNELAVNLPVLFKSVKKWKYVKNTKRN